MHSINDQWHCCAAMGNYANNQSISELFQMYQYTELITISQRIYG